MNSFLCLWRNATFQEKMVVWLAARKNEKSAQRSCINMNHSRERPVLQGFGEIAIFQGALKSVKKLLVERIANSLRLQNH